MSKTMTNMSKDEKRMMFFDMQEHPEKYTDEQVEHLLADEIDARHAKSRAECING